MVSSVWALGWETTTGLMVSIEAAVPEPTRYQNHCWFNWLLPSTVQPFMPVWLLGSMLTDELPLVRV